MALNPLPQGVAQVLLAGAGSEVAELRAEQGQPPAGGAIDGYGKAALLVGPQGEVRRFMPRPARQGDGQGSQTAAQPQHHRPACAYPHHGVVEAVDNLKAMAQNPIRQMGQERAIGVGIPAEGFARAVGAGGHHSSAKVFEQQVVQARGGCHHPQPGTLPRHF